MDDRQTRLVADHLIVALDTDTVDDALAVVDDVGDAVALYKIGSRLFTAGGPAVLDALADRGKRVFLDLKYHDIPSVVGSAVAVVAEHHECVFLTTIHAAGGPAMIAAAAEAASTRETLSVIAVTALTSLSHSETRLIGVDMNLDDWVLKLAELAVESGADGLVCSPNEVGAVRDWLGADPLIVTPGVRLQGPRPGEDQARVATPADALGTGSTYLVMGRPIVGASDRAAVIEQIGASL
jgi:orotidine-5'-phosphate decarboxylase